MKIPELGYSETEAWDSQNHNSRGPSAAPSSSPAIGNPWVDGPQADISDRAEVVGGFCPRGPHWLSASGSLCSLLGWGSREDQKDCELLSCHIVPAMPSVYRCALPRALKAPVFGMDAAAGFTLEIH